MSREAGWALCVITIKKLRELAGKSRLMAVRLRPGRTNANADALLITMCKIARNIDPCLFRSKRLIQYGFLRFMRGRDKCRRWLLCHAEYPRDINRMGRTWGGVNVRRVFTPHNRSIGFKCG